MLKNRNELIELREKCTMALDSQTLKVLICAGTGCVAGGSIDVYNRLS